GDPKRRRVALVGAAIAVAVVGIVVCCWAVYANAVRNLAIIQSQQQSLDASLQTTRKDGKLIKALDDWDNAVVLDEIYDLTDRIPDVNALRVTSLAVEPTTRT